MSFVERVVAFVLLLPALALAEGEAFRLSAPIPDDYRGRTAEFTSEMKHQAVVRWLRKEMGDAFAGVEEKVTPEFTEKYVLDFTRKTTVVSGTPHIEVSGHLDAKALKEWSRVAAVKSDESGMNPLLILSVDFPENTIYPQETAEKVASDKYAKIISKLLGDALARLNVNPKIVPLRRFPFNRPARTEQQITVLREVGLATDSKTALWLHLSSCYSCGGAKLDLYFYNFEQNRIAGADTADLTLSQSDFASEARLAEVLTPPVKGFAEKLEGIVSKGALFSSVFNLVVKGIPYTSHKQLEDQFSKLDYIVRILLKSVEPDGAEYEVMSSVGLAEFSQRIASSPFNGFQIKVVTVEADSITVRYWKPGSPG